MKLSPFDYLLARFDAAAAVLIDSVIDAPPTLDVVLFLTSNPAIVATADDFARYLGRPVHDVRASLTHLAEVGCVDVIRARRPLYLLTRDRQRRHELFWIATQLSDPRAQREVRKWLCLHSLDVLEGGAKRPSLHLVPPRPSRDSTGDQTDPPPAG